MADGRWRISVTAPDWGQDHLSLEAVVAFVDGELAPGPHARATQHLGQCPECAAQVVAQGQARTALRTAGWPCLPSALLSSLRAIPQDTDLPGPPPGLAMTGRRPAGLGAAARTGCRAVRRRRTARFRSDRHRPAQPRRPRPAAPAGAPASPAARRHRGRRLRAGARARWSSAPPARQRRRVRPAPAPASRPRPAAAGVRRPDGPPTVRGRAAAARPTGPRPGRHAAVRPLIAAATRTSPPLRHAGGRSDPAALGAGRHDDRAGGLSRGTPQGGCAVSDRPAPVDDADAPRPIRPPERTPAPATGIPRTRRGSGPARWTGPRSTRGRGHVRPPGRAWPAASPAPAGSGAPAARSAGSPPTAARRAGQRVRPAGPGARRRCNARPAARAGRATTTRCSGTPPPSGTRGATRTPPVALGPPAGRSTAATPRRGPRRGRPAQRARAAVRPAGAAARAGRARRWSRCWSARPAGWSAG